MICFFLSFFLRNFLFIIFIYLFLFLAVLGLHCRMGFSVVGASGGYTCSAWASHCGGFSYCRAWALGTDFSSCGRWAR